MRPLYIVEQGIVVKKSSERLLLTKEGKIVEEIPIFKLNRIVLMGSVQLTSNAIALILQNGIDIHYLSYKGKIRGTLSPVLSKNIYLRLAQYDRYSDNEFKLTLSKNVVTGKLKNQRRVLNRYQRNYPDIHFDKELGVIDKLLNDVENKKNIDSVRGCEGAASGAYFRAFGKMVRGELKFESRRKHPSPDQVNSLLSFGYSLITSELVSLLSAASFDPLLGFLHGIKYGRNSLALDMVEEFRHPLIDKFTLYLINNKILKAEDFEKESDGGCYLTSEKVKKYFQLFNKRMHQDVVEGETKTTWSDLLRRQVGKMEKAVLRKIKYEPYVGKE